MVRIAISVEAFEAIARTFPLGSVGYENEADERGVRNWLAGCWRSRGRLKPQAFCHHRHVGQRSGVLELTKPIL
jgi:hypothetical protein